MNDKFFEELTHKTIYFYTYTEFLATQKLELIDTHFVKNSIEGIIDNEAIFIIIENDIFIDGNLSLLELDKKLRAIGKLTSDQYIHQIWFSGKVEISNTLYDEDTEDLSTSLVFENDFKAKNIIFGGTSLFFLKQVEITQLFYTQINSEGGIYWKNAEKSVKMKVDNNQIWSIQDKHYHLGEYEIDSALLDKIFLKKDDFFFYDEDEQCYYPLEEDDKLIAYILEDKNIFN